MLLVQQRVRGSDVSRQLWDRRSRDTDDAQKLAFQRSDSENRKTRTRSVFERGVTSRIRKGEREIGSMQILRCYRYSLTSHLWLVHSSRSSKFTFFFTSNLITPHNRATITHKLRRDKTEEKSRLGTHNTRYSTQNNPECIVLPTMQQVSTIWNSDSP